MSSKTEHNYVYDPVWAEVMRRYLSGAKGESGMTYEQISDALETQFGIHQNATNLKSKFSKANFGAQLFIQLVIVMGKSSVDLNHMQNMYTRAQNQ